MICCSRVSQSCECVFYILLFSLPVLVRMVKLYYLLFIFSFACSATSASSSSSSSDEDVPRLYSPAWWGGFDSSCLSELEREVGMYLTMSPRIFCLWCTASFFLVPLEDEEVHQRETIVPTTIRKVEETLYPQGLENVLETSVIFPHADGRLKLSEIFVLKRALVAIAIYYRVGLLETVGTKKGVVPKECLVNEKMEETFSVLTFQMIIVRTRGWNFLKSMAGKMHLSRFSEILGKIGFRSNLDWFNYFFIHQNDND